MGKKGRVIVVQQKTTSGCMVAFWVLLGLCVLSVGGCFLVGGAGCVFLEAVDEAQKEQQEENRDQVEGIGPVEEGGGGADD